ncbi:MAG: SGNH/GDSL hydrolase family protein [Polyangiales bacterium]
MRLPSLSALGLVAACAVVGCSEDPTAPIDRETDEATADEDEAEEDDAKPGKLDASTKDGGRLDAGIKDSGPKADAGEEEDSGAPPKNDAGFDAGKDAGKDASADAGTDAGAAGELCHLAGNEVAVIGDSYIQLSGDFTRLLQDKARAVKALGANERYMDHSLSGASMNGTPAIPPQLDDAIAAAKRGGSKGIKLVIMTGGGNDVLVNNRPCLDPKSVAEVEASATCTKVVDDTLATAQKLFDHGVEEGVKAVVYFFYPHLPKDSFGAGPNANNVLDYSIPRAKALCEKQTKAPCYFVDMREPFNDPSNDGWPKPGLIAFDGIHPTLKGSQILADEVWKVMQAQCLASK